MRIGPSPYLSPPPISEEGLRKAEIRPVEGMLEPFAWPKVGVMGLPAGDAVSRFHCKFAVPGNGLVMLAGLRMLRGFPLMNFPGGLTDG